MIKQYFQGQQRVIGMKKSQFYQQEEELLINKRVEVDECRTSDALGPLSSQLSDEPAGLTNVTCFSSHPSQKYKDIDDESNDTEKIETKIENNDVCMLTSKQQRDTNDFLLERSCQKQPQLKVCQPQSDELQQILAIRALVAEGIKDFDTFLRKQKERKIAFQKKLQKMALQRERRRQQFLKMIESRQSSCTEKRFSERHPAAHKQKTEGKAEKNGSSWFKTIKQWFSCLKDDTKAQ